MQQQSLFLKFWAKFSSTTAARIDELYLNEQELLFDSEVCEVGRATASEILGGKDLTLAIACGKVAAWKGEVDAVESLMVRWKARECGQVPIRQLQRDLRRRRERATSKLFVWFDRVMQASRPFHEVKKMEEAMGAVLHRIREN